MKFDIQGRIRNMRLPNGRTALLYSIYEAVSNGIHAIEERFGSDTIATAGLIGITVALDESKDIASLTIRDNGIGLNPRHLTSFETCDTLEKSGIGGRGVGRLVWLKAFSTVSVSSTHAIDGGAEQVTFRFDPHKDDSLDGLQRSPAGSNPIGTTIVLTDIQADHTAKLGLVLLARSLCHHFFAYFIAGSMPRLTITLGKRTIDIGQYLATRMTPEAEEDVDLTAAGLGILRITHVYVDPKIARELSNSILLTAQGRVVESVEIEKKFALRGLENKKAYACVVRGPFLDEKVDQERISFKATPADIEAIKDAALDAAERFLGAHIRKIRVTQKGIVVDLLEEHPQFALSVPNVDDYVAKLSPSMSDEDIGKTLFTLLYRHEKRVRAQIEGLASEEPNATEEGRANVEALVQRVTDDAKRRLAEYTIKRHQIIQIARSMLRYSDAEKQSYAWEKALHDVICPMGKMLSAKNYSDHNLWLIDDLLSYYQFFASDKSLTALGVAGEREEPDLIFFNPFGFRREGTNDPVVIIEFKRPGDENLSSDPIDQVLGYIEKLRLKTVRDAEGEVVSDIGEHTPFECIVICDLTAGARRKFERSVAQNPTPDGLGYYGFSQRHNASIRVLSYGKLFRDAELRNQSFFDHLGLLPEEVRKALRASADIAVAPEAIPAAEGAVEAAVQPALQT